MIFVKDIFPSKAAIIIRTRQFKIITVQTSIELCQKCTKKDLAKNPMSYFFENIHWIKSDLFWCFVLV